MSSCAAARWNMFIGRVQTAAREAFAKVIVVAEAMGLLEERHTGGYFCLLMLGAEECLVPPMVLGEVPDDKAEKYSALCLEKARRLEAQYKAAGDLTSWQSRNPEAEQWGGAILGPDGQDRQYAFSFSGLPELVDEALTLRVAVKVGHLTGEEALEMGEASGSNELLFGCLDLDDLSPEE